jgi:hypothetical protein
MEHMSNTIIQLLLVLLCPAFECFVIWQDGILAVAQAILSSFLLSFLS